MAKVVRVGEEIRDVCSRIACKLKNALDDYYLNGIKNEQLGITDGESAERGQEMLERMEEVAVTGTVETAYFVIIQFMFLLYDELSVCKE
jgi:hypothetical protein